jgi:putative tricarboxylic transport membrane protein
MGIFGIAEILVAVTAPGGAPEVQRVPLRTLYPSREEMRRSTMPIARGTLLGFLIGLLPGPATILASFTSYAIERRLARRPEEFGRGAVEGVAGPEAANNSATSGAMVPLLALGLPFAPATAMLLGGFMIHGITPGPLLMVQHPDVFWGLVVSMYIGNAMLLILNLPLVGVFASLIRTPARILMPLIMALVVLGAYAVNNRMFDVWIMLIAGAFGYALRLARISPAPLVVGFVLGPFAELYARQSLAILYGQPAAILARPISGALLALTAVIVAAPPVLRLLRGRLVAGR